ncbi:hypothetical protein SARC_00601 [Sphaeroforma arctica JP610]|uniref:C2H2-type domain-containing protein n=1 Tax=Sphaeroforma arctica JP610 TaxID=667725 RepID=A0A0L0GG62_9EUKA|nr:hypothetical protein SARC_00601 [Sphaeroforma arctica JP610]KNC87273.1 hypothetical protein SARC_00601 [Sphaeroforma arctica JP610]|eukprot:XP_014161175.1 hypothetical protein SARC_00601 [Sphaeroforma arctica JP610]
MQQNQQHRSVNSNTKQYNQNTARNIGDECSSDSPGSLELADNSSFDSNSENATESIRKIGSRSEKDIRGTDATVDQRQNETTAGRNSLIGGQRADMQQGRKGMGDLTEALHSYFKTDSSNDCQTLSGLNHDKESSSPTDFGSNTTRSEIGSQGASATAAEQRIGRSASTGTEGTVISHRCETGSKTPEDTQAGRTMFSQDGDYTGSFVSEKQYMKRIKSEDEESTAVCNDGVNNPSEHTNVNDITANSANGLKFGSKFDEKDSLSFSGSVAGSSASKLSRRRRKAAELKRAYFCKYDRCGKTYASNHARNLHYRLKHARGNSVFCDLAKSPVATIPAIPTGDRSHLLHTAPKKHIPVQPRPIAMRPTVNGGAKLVPRAVQYLRIQNGVPIPVAVSMPMASAVTVPSQLMILQQDGSTLVRCVEGAINQGASNYVSNIQSSVLSQLKSQVLKNESQEEYTSCGFTNHRQMPGEDVNHSSDHTRRQIHGEHVRTMMQQTEAQQSHHPCVHSEVPKDMHVRQRKGSKKRKNNTDRGDVPVVLSTPTPSAPIAPINGDGLVNVNTNYSTIPSPGTNLPPINGDGLVNVNTNYSTIPSPGTNLPPINGDGLVNVNTNYNSIPPPGANFITPMQHHNPQECPSQVQGWAQQQQQQSINARVQNIVKRSICSCNHQRQDQDFLTQEYDRGGGSPHYEVFNPTCSEQQQPTLNHRLMEGRSQRQDWVSISPTSSTQGSPDVAYLYGSDEKVPHVHFQSRDENMGNYQPLEPTVYGNTNEGECRRSTGGRRQSPCNYPYVTVQNAGQTVRDDFERPTRNMRYNGMCQASNGRDLRNDTQNRQTHSAQRQCQNQQPQVVQMQMSTSPCNTRVQGQQWPQHESVYVCNNHHLNPTVRNQEPQETMYHNQHVSNAQHLPVYASNNHHGSTMVIDQEPHDEMYSNQQGYITNTQQEEVYMGNNQYENSEVRNQQQQEVIPSKHYHHNHISKRDRKHTRSKKKLFSTSDGIGGCDHRGSVPQNRQYHQTHLQYQYNQQYPSQQPQPTQVQGMAQSSDSSAQDQQWTQQQQYRMSNMYSTNPPMNNGPQNRGGYLRQ